MITIQLHHLLLLIIGYLAWRVIILTIFKVIAKKIIDKLMEDNENKAFKNRVKEKMKKYETKKI